MHTCKRKHRHIVIPRCNHAIALTTFNMFRKEKTHRRGSFLAFTTPVPSQPRPFSYAHALTFNTPIRPYTNTP